MTYDPERLAQTLRDQAAMHPRIFFSVYVLSAASVIDALLARVRVLEGPCHSHNL